MRLCRAQQPSARSQPLARPSLTLNSSEKFRLTLLHEKATHCNLVKLRARHMKRHMNKGNAKQGPQSTWPQGRNTVSVWSLRQTLDSPRQADRSLGQSNAQKRPFDRPGLYTFWRNDSKSPTVARSKFAFVLLILTSHRIPLLDRCGAPQTVHALQPRRRKWGQMNDNVWPYII